MAGVVSAATTTFDFSTAAGAESTLSGALSFTQSSLTVTVRELNTTGGTGLTGGYAENYNGFGLGACTTSEGSNCGSPQHQVDNVGNYEFLLFRFSSPVNLSSVSLRNFGSTTTVDMDMSYWFSTSTAASMTLSDITSLGNGFGSQNNVTYGGAGSTTSTVNVAGYGSSAQSVDTLSGSNVTWLLVGAAYAGDATGDYFKINSLTVATATPEPGTLVLFALAGTLFLAGRRFLVYSK